MSSRSRLHIPSLPAQDRSEVYRTVVLTTDARFVQVNKAFCSMTGYAEAELLALDFAALTHPEDQTWMAEQVEQLLGGAIQTFSMEQRYIRKDGGMLPTP